MSILTSQTNALQNRGFFVLCGVQYAVCLFMTLVMQTLLLLNVKYSIDSEIKMWARDPGVECVSSCLSSLQHLKHFTCWASSFGNRYTFISKIKFVPDLRGNPITERRVPHFNFIKAVSRCDILITNASLFKKNFNISQCGMFAGLEYTLCCPCTLVWLTPYKPFHFTAFTRNLSIKTTVHIGLSCTRNMLLMSKFTRYLK